MPRTCSVLLNLLLLTVTAVAQTAAPLSGQRQTVLKGGGYFPVLIRLQDGRLLAVLRGGGAHIDVKGRLDIITSRDNGATWSAPQTVVDGPDDDRNPALGQLKDGTILLSYVILRGYDESGVKFKKPGRSGRPFDGVYIVRSYDGGRTWTKPERSEAIHAFYNDQGAVSPFGKIVQLPDGTVLMSVYFEFHDERGFQTYLFRSRDNGRTWDDPTLVGKGVNETAILALREGTLLAAMRSGKDQGEALSITMSRDQGHTWSTPASVTQVREHPADLIQLRNRDILLSYGERNPPYGIRALVSHDQGRTWTAPSAPLILANDASNIDCGYPSSVQLPDGKLLTLYYQVNDAATAPASAEARRVIWSLPQ